MVFEFLIVQRENRGRPCTENDFRIPLTRPSCLLYRDKRERGEKVRRRESCSLSLRHATTNLRESRRRTSESIEIVYISVLGEKYERAYNIFTITEQEVTRGMLRDGLYVLSVLSFR